MPDILWSSGTAYDFFLSLFVLHHAADFGIRPAWAAGVRQRLSARSRETLEHIQSFSTAPLAWINLLPAPRDATTALHAVSSLLPEKRIPLITISPEVRPGIERLLNGIAFRGVWTAEERTELSAGFKSGPKPTTRGLEDLLKAWMNLEETGRLYLSALQEYYQVFFAEEEHRIQPALEEGLARAQAQAVKLQPAKLIERISRGVHLEVVESLKRLVIVPSWWVTPLAFLVRPSPDEMLIAFGIRPEMKAGSAGAEAPESLVNALKSLGDPSRLRILHFLSSGPQSPSELARSMRLRPPTVIHHLRLLRFSGLVKVTVGENMEKRYALRPEALNDIFSELHGYLDLNGEHR